MHSGDSACSIPPQTIAQECLDTIREWTPKLAKALKVVGLINIQYCIQDNEVSPLRPRPVQSGFQIQEHPHEPRNCVNTRVAKRCGIANLEDRLMIHNNARDADKSVL